ncbi:MAG: hypothetical protein LAO07_13795 [Acidobacteriia bacterium]|nr:hypothetical protein [Terriglobia bacterium]
MESHSRNRRLAMVWYRGAVIAFALAICLGASPLWTAQDQQDAPQEAVQQPADEPAPDNAPQAPPAEYLQVPRTLTVPAGTLITIRTSQYLSSDQNRPGDGFSAELQQPLVVHGWVLARRGQTVLGRVAVAQKAGRIKGVSQLGVELSQLVLVDGQQLPIHTQLMQTSGGTSHGPEAAAVGTTTAIGAAIGAAAHGGEGAGIGAAAGAGAGLAGVLLTRGRQTVIPPETSLTFRLEFPLTISTERSRVAFRPVEPEDYNAGRTFQRRTERFAVAPRTPPPAYWGGYYPWGYYYPGPFFGGFYRFGGHGHRHRW